MDAHRFDALTQRLTAGLNRRRTLGLLTLLGVPGLATLNVADAKKKKKKKPCPPCIGRKKGKCKKTLPDGTACSDGTCQAGICVAPTPPPPPPPPPPGCGQGGACMVFLSSLKYPGGLGGLSGADAKCQSLANAAGLPGSYKAWLSDSSSTPASRFARSPGPYQLVNGVTIAANWADLTDGALAAPIDLTEAGGAPAGGVWTNTDATGQERLGGHSCINWTSSSMASTGIIGNATLATESWTVGPVTFCDVTHHLYCFQQS